MAINNITSQTGLYGLSRPGQSRRTPLSTPISEDDRQTRKLGEMKSALQQLKSFHKSDGELAEQRKAMARQKIERLKAMIKNLKMMAAVNPGAVAKQAARLARELKQAVKEYAGADGTTDASMKVSSSDLPQGEQAAAGSAEAAADGAVKEAENAAAGAENQSGAQEGATAGNTTEGSAAEDGTAQDGKENPEDAIKDPLAAMREDAQTKVAELQKKAAKQREDQEFINAVRELARDLKQLLEQARKHMKAEGRTDDKQAIKDGEKALKEVDKALDEIANGNAAATLSVAVNILA